MKTFKKIFSESTEDKLTDKAIMKSITVSIVSILLCLAVLCSVTWAWFSENVTSSSNVIKTGDCTITISIRNETDTEIIPEINNLDTYAFEADKSYQIKITSVGSVQSSYCKLVIRGKEYYTEQISTTAPNNTIAFMLTFEEQTDIKIVKRWGTYHISNDERDFCNGKSYTNLVEN